MPTPFPLPTAERPLVLLSRRVPELMLADRVLAFKKKMPMLFYLTGAPHTFYISHVIAEGQPDEKAKPAHAGLYHAFTGKKPKGMSQFRIMVPGKQVKHIGLLKAIEYESPKEWLHTNHRRSRPDQMYVHELQKPHAQVYQTANGLTTVVHGGAMKISRDENGIAWLDL